MKPGTDEGRLIMNKTGVKKIDGYFDEVRGKGKNIRSLHKLFVKNKIRFFNISIDNKTTTLVHPSKTIKEWRSDLRKAIRIVNGKKENGNADIMLTDSMIREFGYIEIENIIDDVFEGGVELAKAKIIDRPAHDVQKDGFGHYGWVNIDGVT